MSKEISQLIRAAEKAGAVVTRARNGHWRVVNPATGRSTQIPASPGGSCRPILNARTRMRRIGIAL